MSSDMKDMEYTATRQVDVLASGKYQGYDYVILSLGTHPCAYVRLPKTHPSYQQEYDNVDIDVHGGLTYSHETVTGSGKKGWWIGWDYAHLGDFCGYDITSGMGDGNDYKWTTAEVFGDVKHAITQLKQQQTNGGSE